MEKEESLRLHLDWYGKCRTCKFWQGTDELDKEGNVIRAKWDSGLCTHPKSPFYQLNVFTEGYCQEWESFDPEVENELFKKEMENKNERI